MPYKVPVNLDNCSVADMVTELLELRADMIMISAEFFNEAIRRDWCGDYDRWARMMNRKLSRPVFVDRDSRLPAIEDMGYLRVSEQIAEHVVTEDEVTALDFT